MLRFLRLSFRNAGTYSSTPVDISFEKQGRVFVNGQNEDTLGSNGAGKSTLFDVLQHVLYATTPKGFARADFAGQDFEATVELESDGHHYSITQFRAVRGRTRSSGYEILRDGVDVTPQGTRHMQDCINYIKSVIGVTEAEFHGYIYLIQQSEHVLVSGKASAKREYLSELFSLDRFDQVRDSIDEELSKIKSEMSVLSNKAAVRDELISQLNKLPFESGDPSIYFESIKETKSFVEQRAEKWAKKLKEADEARARTGEKSRLEAQLTSKLPNWQEVDFESEISSRKEKITKLRSRVDKLETIKDLEDEKKELEASFVEDVAISEDIARSSLENAKTQLSALENNIVLINRRIVLESQLPDVEGVSRDIKLRLKKVEQSLSQTRFQLQESQSTLARLSELTGNSCHACGQSLNPAAIEQQKQKNAKLCEALSGDVNKLEKESKTLAKLVERVEEFQRLQARISELPQGDLTLTKESIKELREEIDNLNHALSVIKKNTTTISRLAEISRKLALVPKADTAKIPEYQERLGKLQQGVDNLNKFMGMKTQLLAMTDSSAPDADEYDRIQELHAYFKGAVYRMATIVAEAKAFKKNFETIKARLEELDAQLESWEQIQKRKGLFEAMKKAYGTKGLKITQLKKVCAAVCAALPKYTSIMFQEPVISFFVDNDPEVTEIDFYVRRVVDGEVVEYPVGKLSGGEKKRLAISLIFTLAELVSPRKRSNLIILDEAGDSLDPVGESAFVEQLLPSLKQETVIITSHRPGIAAARFDKEWTIRKKDGVSTISEVATGC